MKRFHPLTVPFLLSLALSVLALAAGAGLSTVSAWLIATAATLPGIAAIQVAVTGVRSLGIARGGLRYLERLQGHRMALAWSGRLRLRALDELAARTPAVSERAHGDWLARLLVDVESLRDFFVRGLQTPVSALVLLAVSVAILLPYGATALAFAASALLTAAILPLATLHLTRSRQKTLTALRGERIRVAMDLREGRDELRLSGSWGPTVDKLAALDRTMERVQMTLARHTAVRESLGLVTGGLFLLGMVFHLRDLPGLSPVAMVTLSLAILALQEIFQQVPDSIAHMVAHRETFRRIAESHGLPLAVRDTGHGTIPNPGSPLALAIRNLRYRYPAATRDAVLVPDMHLEPGSPITILGPSGSGKSTFFALLRRVADPTEGALSLQSLALPSWDLGALRRTIAWVPQHPWFTSGSLRENLAIARPEATESEMRHVLATAGLGPWFDHLKSGLDEPLGSGFARLSGGEATRLAMARALLLGASVLLVDEGDAHLDPIASKEWARVTRTLARDHLVLRITHRTDDLLPEDPVLVFRSGRPAVHGTCGDLRIRMPDLF